MAYKYFLLLFLALSGINLYGQTRTVHVVVALCDNKNQGIVPVPAGIGNGQDAAGNLYWGCGYGVKTFLKKQKDWKLVKQVTQPEEYILERVIFKHTASDTYLVADAYDGAYIKQTTIDLLDYASGKNKQVIDTGSGQMKAGGDASLICYIGHNGLMDFRLSGYPARTDEQQRDIAIFACASKNYFTGPVKRTGANPLIWTTNLMCPEAYTLVALLSGWIKKEEPASIREQVAQAYHQYQKCGIGGARKLFVTGW